MYLVLLPDTKTTCLSVPGPQVAETLRNSKQPQRIFHPLGLCLSFLKASHTHYVSKVRPSPPNIFTLLCLHFTQKLQMKSTLSFLIPIFFLLSPRNAMSVFYWGMRSGEPKKTCTFKNNTFPSKVWEELRRKFWSFFLPERRKLYNRSHLLL